MQIVNIHEAKTQLSRFIDKASLGESVIIARAGKPVARLMPLESERKLRTLGLGKNVYTLPAGFDALHREAIQAMFASG